MSVDFYIIIWTLFKVSIYKHLRVLNCQDGKIIFKRWYWVVWNQKVIIQRSTSAGCSSFRKKNSFLQLAVLTLTVDCSYIITLQQISTGGTMIPTLNHFELVPTEVYFNTLISTTSAFLDVLIAILRKHVFVSHRLFINFKTRARALALDWEATAGP